MSHSTLQSQEIDLTEAGFSIVEALVVMLIGSMLLSVLTPLLITSTRMNEKLSDVFEDRSDRIFFDLQFSELIDSFIDTSLRSPGLTTEDEERFVGTPVSFSGKAYTPFGLSAETTDVWVGWTRHNPDESQTLSDANTEKNRLMAKIGDRRITWPLLWPENARLFYVDGEGKTHQSWPPKKEPLFILYTNPSTGTHGLPMAIGIIDAGVQDHPPIFFIYNLKL